MRRVIALERTAMAISQDEREFFVALGSRIAQFRKDSHITQVQLAETLGVSQPTMNAYELGQRRVPVSALPVLAKALGVGLEECLASRAQQRRSAGRRRSYSSRWSVLPGCPRHSSGWSCKCSMACWPRPAAAEPNRQEQER